MRPGHSPFAMGPVPAVGVLRVTIISASHLPKTDLYGSCDPYCTASFEDGFVTVKTEVKKNTLNPNWNETFLLPVQNPTGQVLKLVTYDWNSLRAVRHAL